MGVSDNFVGLVQRTNDSFIRDNIYMVGRPLLARALKTIEPQYQDKILRNMTSEGAEDVRRFMADMNISTEDAEAAQREIISMAQGYI
jgi:flagellar motor switch protein FliG